MRAWIFIMSVQMSPKWREKKSNEFLFHWRINKHTVWCECGLHCALLVWWCVCVCESQSIVRTLATLMRVNLAWVPGHLAIKHLETTIIVLCRCWLGRVVFHLLWCANDAHCFRSLSAFIRCIRQKLHNKRRLKWLFNRKSTVHFRLMYFCQVDDALKFNYEEKPSFPRNCGFSANCVEHIIFTNANWIPRKLERCEKFSKRFLIH